MEHVKEMLAAVTGRLTEMARANSVVGDKISVGERHVVPLSEIGVGFGAGGGEGEGGGPFGHKGRAQSGKGKGGGAGGGAKVTPVAVLVVDENGVRVETLEGGAR